MKSIAARSAVLLAGLTSLAVVALPAAAATLAGTVFDDADRNGMRDARERGVADVAVSNGRDVVRSDARGQYALTVAPGQTVFIVKPAGWRTPLRADGLPAYWQQMPASAAASLKYAGIATGTMPARADFALRRLPRAAPASGDLDVLVFADPQPKSSTDVDYYRRDIVAPLLGNVDAALGLTLGDVVDDDLSLYPSINAVTASLRVPWLHVAGNHDMNLDAADDTDALQTFRRTYGPDTFAWEESRATFVLLDDVIHQAGRKPAYIGGFRDEQLAFLASYLPTVPKDRLLVVGVHIPLFEPDGKDSFRDADRVRLFSLLKEFPHVLLLSAHSHTQQHWHHTMATGWRGATPLHEYNVGANCGAFWSGAKDAQGIPDATMADGTPNGYATLRVRAGGEYALAWHPARLDARIGSRDASMTDAMALHAPKILRRGAYPAWGVYANVYMGDDDTRVEYRVDDGAWKPMDKVLQADPRLVVENVRDDLAESLRGYDRSPEAKPSTHLWRGALPTTLDAGEHRIDVRTFHAQGTEHRATTRYRLADAAP